MTELPSEQRVTIVTVAYNSMRVLPRMLASVPRGVPVVVVDNASADVDELRALVARHGARLVENPRNDGFGVACNLGAEVAGTEFLLFLNPDAELRPDTLGRLVEAAARYPRSPAMNPRIMDDDGSAFFMRKSHLLPRREWIPRGWPAADREVPVLSGAAFFVRAEAFRAVGGFDPQIFLFHEDDDLALRLRSRFGPLMFVRDALVTHGGGSSSDRNAAIAGLKAWHMGRSRVYAARKHGRPLAGTIAAVQAACQCLSPAVLFSSRKRAKHLAFLGGVLDACATGGAYRRSTA